VLIVEDTPAVAETLVEILADQGYAAVVAASGEAALSYLRQRRLPSVIVLDLVLPGIDGHTVLERLRESAVHRTIPVIVVSALCDSDDAPRLGVAACMSKPVVVENLLAAIAPHCSTRPPRAE
jgi:CheY-like chemotaxis protein